MKPISAFQQLRKMVQLSLYGNIIQNQISLILLSYASELIFDWIQFASNHRVGICSC